MSTLNMMKNSSPVSFWENEFGNYQPNQSFAGDADVDVAIIGAGYTGLSIAREFKKDNPGANLIVLEGKYVGFGASGRNGGFNMSLFGLEPEVTIFRWGKQRAKEAHDYMARAVSYVHQLVKDHDLKSDYEHNGMLRIAYTPAQIKRLTAMSEMLSGLDDTGQRYQFLQQDQLRDQFGSEVFQAAIFERDSGILNPIKHVRELKRLAQNEGAKIYENSPVLNVDRSADKIILKTAKGTIKCKKLVIAVNAWSSQIKGIKKIRSRQTPVWTSQVVTKIIPKETWAKIGWADRASIEDNRQMVHYLRRTKCGRITIGGGNVAIPNSRAMANMDTAKIFSALENRLKWMFPALKDIGFDYRWGGPVSVNLDMTPEIGFIGDERVIYASGCIGHGVSLTQLNGRLIADLLLDKKTELSEFWVVNRKAIPWPIDPIGFASIHAIKSGLNLWDKIEEKSLPKGM